jgi:hypothetical protein
MTRIKGILDQKFLQQLNTIKQGAINVSGRAQKILDENQRSTHRIALMLVKTNNRVYFPNGSQERVFLDKVKELVLGLPYVKVDTRNQAREQIVNMVRKEIHKHLENIEREYQNINEINQKTGQRANDGKEPTATKIKRYNALLTSVVNMVNELKTSLSQIEGVEQKQIHVAHEMLEDALITITIPPEAILTAYKLVYLKAFVKSKIDYAANELKSFIKKIKATVSQKADDAFDYILEQSLSKYGDNPIPDLIQRVKESIKMSTNLSSEFEAHIVSLFVKTLVPATNAEQAEKMAYSDDILLGMNFEQLVSLLNKSSEAFFNCLTPTSMTMHNVHQEGQKTGYKHMNGTYSQPEPTIKQLNNTENEYNGYQSH